MTTGGGGSEGEHRDPGHYPGDPLDVSQQHWISAGEAGWTERQDEEPWYDGFAWWAVIIGALWIALVAKVVLDPDYDLAWARIYPGVWLTITATLRAFLIASVFGALLGLGRSLKADDRTNPAVRVVKIAVRNLCRAYVEFIRGIPILPLIFTVALVIIPPVTDALGVQGLISFEWRAIIALALIYSGYIAEIIRGGIQSVDHGQIEASRSLGMSRGSTTRSIVMPQALRSVIPPLGNDFIAILKDTSLLSVLGILEITQRAKQFANSSFKFREGYLVLTLIYLTLTIVLSFGLDRLERHLSKDRRGAR